MESSSSLREFLETSTLADITELRSQQLFFLKSTDSIEMGFQALVRNRVLGAPVKDEATGEFVGLVDIKDFVEYVLLIFGAGTATVQDLNLDKGLSIRSILNLSKENPFARVSYGAPIMEALKTLSSGLHRMAVTKPGSPSHVIKMVSQMCLLQFLLRHVPLRMNTVENGSRSNWEEVLDRKVGQLRMGTEAKTIVYTQAVMDALALILKERISGTAIVDEHGQLFGSISVWDLKHASMSADVLMVSLKDFWNETKRPLVTVTEDNTLGEAMEKLVNGGIHRLFLVPPQGRPIKVITITDLLAALYHSVC